MSPSKASHNIFCWWRRVLPSICKKTTTTTKNTPVKHNKAKGSETRSAYSSNLPSEGTAGPGGLQVRNFSVCIEEVGKAPLSLEFSVIPNQTKTIQGRKQRSLSSKKTDAKILKYSQPNPPKSVEYNNNQIVFIPAMQE